MHAIAPTVIPATSYRPQFHLTQDERCIWICDGDQRIALYSLEEPVLDWWAYVPGEPLIDSPELPLQYEMGSRLQQHALLCWCSWQGHRSPDVLNHSWDVAPDRITLTVSGSYPDGGQSAHVWSIWYDAASHRYHYTLSVDLRVTLQDDIEFVNFYPARMLHSDPAQRRFTHTVWRGEDGNWKSLPHSVALTLHHLMGRRKYLPSTGGEVGFVTDPQCNPFCRINASSRPLVMETCDMWWDEHIIIPRPSMEERVDGLFVYTAIVEWYSLPEQEAKDILAQATPFPISPREAARSTRVSFRLNALCDFAQLADMTSPKEAMCWALEMFPHASWIDDPTRTHSGSRALVLQGQGSNHPLECHPLGAYIQIGPGHRGRLSVWINTEQLQGQAWIELRSFCIRERDIERAFTSQRLPGGCGWTQLIIEGETLYSPYLHPHLWVDGVGEVVFDDLRYDVL